MVRHRNLIHWSALDVRGGFDCHILSPKWSAVACCTQIQWGHTARTKRIDWPSAMGHINGGNGLGSELAEEIPNLWASAVGNRVQA